MTAKMLKEANQLNKLDFEIAEAEKEKTAIGLKIKENKESVESKGEALKESWLDQCVRFFLATVHCSLCLCLCLCLFRDQVLNLFSVFLFSFFLLLFFLFRLSLFSE